MSNPPRTYLIPYVIVIFVISFLMEIKSFLCKTNFLPKPDKPDKPEAQNPNPNIIIFSKPD